MTDVLFDFQQFHDRHLLHLFVKFMTADCLNVCVESCLGE